MTGARDLARARLRTAFDAALAAVDPARVIPAALTDEVMPPDLVLGAGKAAAAMAAAVERRYGSPLHGLVVVPYDHGASTRGIEVLEAGHPFPDQASARAAGRMLALAEGLGEGKRALVLLSGGGSALTTAPPPGVGFDELRETLRALTLSGAPIAAVNTVRRHLSRFAGGRLAAAAFPAAVRTLAISDVPDATPEVIASGPTVADPTSLADARAVLAGLGLEAPAAVARALTDPVNETHKPGDPRLARSEFRLLAGQAEALAAAAAVLRAEGFEMVDLGTDLTGDATNVAVEHAALALDLARAGRRAAILSGGEVEVAASSNCSGGANRHYALALALALAGDPRVCALAADSDGLDGSPDAAGGFVFPDTLDRLRARGLEAASLLAACSSGEAFAALGDALVTGPTRTNVSDLRLILVEP